MIPLVLPAIPTHAQTNPGSSASAKKEPGMSRCLWRFEVNIDPQPSDKKGGGAAIARMLLDKHFRGDLEATSKGTMLASGTGAKGSSGGYVALEIVTGTFVLQHSAIKNRSVPQLSVTVISGSGIGRLTGIAGTMETNIVTPNTPTNSTTPFPKIPDARTFIPPLRALHCIYILCASTTSLPPTSSPS
jgi:hypothetical protein